MWSWKAIEGISSQALEKVCKNMNYITNHAITVKHGHVEQDGM